MKTQTEALIASVMVLAMLLSAAGGVTYSWFSDEHSVEMSTSTAKVDCEWTLEYDNVKMETDLIAVGNVSGEHSLEVSVKNNGTMPVVYSSKFIAERYSAYTASKNYSEYKADYIMDEEKLVQEKSNSWSEGYFQLNLQAFQVEIGGKYESLGIWSSPEDDCVYGEGMSLDLGGATTSLDIKRTQWWIANEDLVVMPGETATMTFSLQYTKEIQKNGSGSTTTVSYSTDHAPTVRFVSSCVQADSYTAVQMSVGNDGKLTGTATVKQSDAGFVFYGGTSLAGSTTRVVIGWDAIDIKGSIGKTLTVTVENVNGGKEVTVSGSDDCKFKDGGRISYQLDLGTAVSVQPASFPLTVWTSDAKTLVSFSDSVGTLEHTVQYSAGT